MTELPEAGNTSVAELAALRERVEELEAILSAIRNGEVDAFVVSGATGDQTYSLQRADEGYRSLVEAMGEGAALITEAGLIVYCNRVMEQLAGRESAHLVGVLFSEVLRSGDLTKMVATAMATGFSSAELGLQHADGEVMPVQMTLSPIADSEPPLLAVICTDLRQSKSKFEAALASMSDAVFISDVEGNFIHFNDAFATFHKFKNKVECAKSLIEYTKFLEVYSLSGELLPLEQWAVPRALRGETVVNAEFVLHRMDTGETWVGSYNFAPIRDAKGVIVGSVVSGRDITDRKKAEVELEQHRHHLEELVEQRSAELALTEAKASHILNSSADGLYGIDAEGKITFINPAACALLGFTPEQVLGHYPHSLFHHSRPDGSPFPLEKCSIHNALLSGAEVRVDNEVFWHADGHPVQLMYAMHPMVQDGKVTGAVVSFVDISVQRAAAEARERALIAAENLIRLRSEFLANMSHEIRTPLNGVLGFAEIGARNPQNPEKALKAFNQIIASGKSLLGIINDILDFSKIEAGKLTIEQTPVALADVIRNVYVLISPRVQNKQLQLKVKLAPDMPKTFISDPLRLGQVLLNLMSNAVKFTEAGSITLSASKQGEQLEFKVADTGIGMDVAQLSLLFQPFQQADGSTTRKFGGTGLGLAISKRILELMHGDISVESQPGVGSTFTFRVPYVKDSDEIVAQDEVRTDFVETGSVRIPLATPLAGISILVAEDNPVNQQVLEELLTDAGARVMLVNNGREAVERIHQYGAKAYNVVLMDVEMPEMNGYEATRQILALAPNLPIIGQTAHVMPEEKALCHSAGMVDQIAKPIDPDALVAVVLRYVATQ
jgi:hypothetical protein